MQPPVEPPNASTLGLWASYALNWLQDQLGEAAPLDVDHPVIFPRSPLEGEGACVIFEFVPRRDLPANERHYVVVGRTEANYYPHYGLSADEAFSLHLGTRFMLVMQVAQRHERSRGREGAVGVASEETAPSRSRPGADYDPIADARDLVNRVAPDRSLEDVRLAATFDVEGRLHAVLRARLGGAPIYLFARDAPAGFSLRVDLPPPVVYRMHLGMVLRQEAAPVED